MFITIIESPKNVSILTVKESLVKINVSYLQPWQSTKSCLKIPEAVHDVLVVEDEHLPVLEADRGELDGPRGDVDWLHAHDGAGQLELPQLLALAREADEGLLHRRHSDGLLAAEEADGLNQSSNVANS